MTAHDWIKVRRKDYDTLVYLAFKYGMNWKCVECKWVCTKKIREECKERIDKEMMNKIVQICMSSKVIE
jgi:hypothetical protein